ncbi:tyrosine-type recombinase/integrase [Psychrobacillus psychrotolerans]|uniref:tyrosine-type recombinase/integrase n=1 Tax=Psychrobacillus psychrotolerans TaxID=126156 RepID=UPI003C77ACC4
MALDDEVLRELRKFKLKQNEMIIGDMSFRQNEDGIIFQNFLGNYLTPSTVRDSIRDYCEKASVDYKGTHGFRHTHAVLLLESGASIKFVSNRLGHKTIKTTADTYLDITEKIKEDELKKFASYTSRKTVSARNRHE